MSILQLSFHGPFLYRFAPNHVELYAPKCPGHTAGLFTAKNEIPFTGRHRYGNGRRYEITGPVFGSPATQPPQFHDPDGTILDASKVAKPVLHKAHFCLIVPLPQIVYPLQPHEVEVVDNSTVPPGQPTGSLKRRATGLRFYYQADLSKNLMVTLDGSNAPAWIADFDATALGHDFADAEVRYSSDTPELGKHQDALECFDHIAALAGVDWWLSFEDPSKPHGAEPFVHKATDCMAAILTVR